MNDILGHIDRPLYGEYSYFLTDLRTNDVIAELPFQEVTYSLRLSDLAEFSGVVLVNDETKLLDLRSVMFPGRVGLYVLRDSKPVWGGIIWKRKYDSSSRKVTIVAETFESYLKSRYQKLTHKFEDTDQLDIARWLLDTDDVAKDILATVSNATSTRKRERQFYSFEYKTVFDELAKLGALIDGFDWNCVVDRDVNSSEITREFKFFYPERGISAAHSTFMFEYPGSIRDFTTNEDAAAGANVTFALGAGEGVDKVVAESRDEAQLAAGYPKLETTRAYSSVSEMTTLQAHADEDQKRLVSPVTVFEVVVDPNEEPQLGTYSVGDWARFRLDETFVTPLIDQWSRITGITVSIDDGSGLEQVKLTLGGDEVSTAAVDEE